MNLGESLTNLVWEKEKLAIKMMKLGIPKKGAHMLIKQLNDEQIKAGINSNDILKDIIDVLYYKK
jgi:hypothetical protein